MINDMNFKGKNGPLLIAEIGGNHEGNFEYAKELTKKAIDTDVDYIKFQLYHNGTIVNKLESIDRYNHFKKFELTKKQHIYLAEMIKEAGLNYMASVWGEEFFKWINQYISIYKVGSGDLTAYPILKKIIEYRKPIILSTGLSTNKEIINTIRYIQNLDKIYCNPQFLAVLQCTAMYPIGIKDVNLSVIKQLKKDTGLTVGYSDHTEGIDALIYSTLFGAEILEFHFTDDRDGKVFRDHKVSLIPEEVEILKSKIAETRAMIGNPEKTPMKIELDNGHVSSFRRAIYPRIDIKAGTILSENNLICLRPNHGVDARNIDFVLGKKTNIDLKALEKISLNNIEM